MDLLALSPQHIAREGHNSTCCALALVTYNINIYIMHNINICGAVGAYIILTQNVQRERRTHAVSLGVVADT